MDLSEYQLIQAAKDDNLGRVEELLKFGCNANARDDDGFSPLYWTCCRGHVNICRLLLGRDCDVNSKGKGGATALMACADNGHSTCLRLLIQDRSIRLDEATERGDTALHMAAYRGFPDIVYLLCLMGANRELLNVNDQTPLGVAFIEGNRECVKILNKPNQQRVQESRSPGVQESPTTTQSPSNEHIHSSLVHNNSKSLDWNGNNHRSWASGQGHSSLPSEHGLSSSSPPSPPSPPPLPPNPINSFYHRSQCADDNVPTATAHCDDVVPLGNPCHSNIHKNSNKVRIKPRSPSVASPRVKSIHDGGFLGHDVTNADVIFQKRINQFLNPPSPETNVSLNGSNWDLNTLTSDDFDSRGLLRSGHSDFSLGSNGSADSQSNPHDDFRHYHPQPSGAMASSGYFSAGANEMNGHSEMLSIDADHLSVNSDPSFYSYNSCPEYVSGPQAICYPPVIKHDHVKSIYSNANQISTPQVGSSVTKSKSSFNNLSSQRKRSEKPNGRARQFATSSMKDRYTPNIAPVQNQIIQARVISPYLQADKTELLPGLNVSDFNENLQLRVVSLEESLHKERTSRKHLARENVKLEKENSDLKAIVRRLTFQIR